MKALAGVATIEGMFAERSDVPPTVKRVTYKDGEVWRRFRVSFTWRSGGRGSTLWLGRNARHALDRFTASMPGISSATVVEEVAL